MTKAIGIRIAATVLFAVVLVLAPAALAGKGGKGQGGGTTTTTSSLSLVVMDGASAPAQYGRVTFDVKTSATDRPFVGLRCYQGSAFVFDGYVSFAPDAMFDQWFTLDSPYWTDGVAANCTARLFYYDRRGNQKVLTTLSFVAA